MISSYTKLGTKEKKRERGEGGGKRDGEITGKGKREGDGGKENGREE